MSFNRETGGRFFSPDSRAGGAPTLPTGDQFRVARVAIEKSSLNAKSAPEASGVEISHSIAELLPAFSHQLPPVIYVASFARVPDMGADYPSYHKVKSSIGPDASRSARTLHVIELNTESGELYIAERDFYGSGTDGGVPEVVTHSREVLDASGWLTFGEETRSILENAAETIQNGEPYKNPNHKMHPSLQLVPDEPNPPSVTGSILSEKEIRNLLRRLPEELDDPQDHHIYKAVLWSARMAIDGGIAQLDATQRNIAREIQRAVTRLLPFFQGRDDVPKIIYITSFNDLPRSIADGLVIENGTKDENRSDEALSIIELDLASGKLYKAKRGFTNFDIAQSPGIRTVAATKTETYSREELGTTGWLEFGGKAVDALQRVAKRIEIGKPYENPRHRVYKKLKLVPDDPNPELVKEEHILTQREIAVLLEDMDNAPQRPLT